MEHYLEAIQVFNSVLVVKFLIPTNIKAQKFGLFFPQKLEIYASQNKIVKSLGVLYVYIQSSILQAY